MASWSVTIDVERGEAEEVAAGFLGEVEDEFGEVGRVEGSYKRDKFRPLARGSECASIFQDFAGSDVFWHCTALRW